MQEISERVFLHVTIIRLIQKHYKFLFSAHIVLQYIHAFSIIYVVQSCSKVFFPQHICSFILYLNIAINNLQYSLLKT